MKIIDMLPGAGKTSGMIEYLANREPGHCYLYITPYNKEVDRIYEYLARAKMTDFQRRYFDAFPEEPLDMLDDIEEYPHCPDGNFTKTSGLLRLMKGGKNIICTHSLFKCATTNTTFWTYVAEHHYELIIDEELSLGYSYPGNVEDLRYLTMLPHCDPPVIKEDEKTGKLTWVDKSDQKFSFYFGTLKEDIMRGNIYIERGNLHCLVPVWEFNKFAEVYLMTYRYESSAFATRWREFFGEGSEEYVHFEGGGLMPGKGEISPTRAKQIVDRLVICDRQRPYPKVEARGHWPFSMNWYKDITDEDLEEVVRSMQAFVRQNAAGKRLSAKKVIWTTYKAYEGRIRMIDAQAGRDSRFISPKVESFVPLNMRATNEFLDRNVVLYAVDRHKNPLFAGVDNDEWALSELVQFLFRTSLRREDTDEKVYVWLPSERMRGLLKGWVERLKEIEE